MHLADEFHLSYFGDDYTDNPHGVFDEETAKKLDLGLTDAPPPATSNRSGAQLRTHRLAIAANRFYTAFHGGTVPLAQAAIVTAINRVSGIYEVEVAVRLQLVAEQQRPRLHRCRWALSSVRSVQQQQRRSRREPGCDRRGHRRRQL